AGESAVVRKALESMGNGGYVEAVARVAALLARHGEPIPLARLDLKRELARKYGDLMPRVGIGEWRRGPGEQEIVVAYEPEGALETLGKLVGKREDRERLRKLVERIDEDARARGAVPTPAQDEMLARIHAVLAPPARLRAPAGRRRKVKA